jgi:hypothetical protein
VRFCHEIGPDIETMLGLGHRIRVSNSDQLFFRAWAIMMLETSASSHSFRSPDLSQSI